MRSPYRLLLSCLLVLTAGCSAPSDTSSLARIPDATPVLYQPGSPVQTRLDVITAGNKLLEDTGGTIWSEAPTAVVAEEMSYAAAQKRIGVGDPQYELWPQETRVWLLVFKGRWQLIPLDPTQANPPPLSYKGGVFSLFTASNGELISVGDSICPIN